MGLKGCGVVGFGLGLGIGPAHHGVLEKGLDQVALALRLYLVRVRGMVSAGVRVRV